MKAPTVEQLKALYSDPRHAYLSEVLKVLEGSRVWSGMDYQYHAILPLKYLPIMEKTKTELRNLAIEYGCVDPDCDQKVLG